jgi:hypothetical protein
MHVYDFSGVHSLPCLSLDEPTRNINRWLKPEFPANLTNQAKIHGLFQKDFLCDFASLFEFATQHEADMELGIR